jgi:phage FluMu gp28-like protein
MTQKNQLPASKSGPAKLINQLLLYQRHWAGDQSRWKFGLMARQVGKDFASGFEGVADCAWAESEGRKIDWLAAARVFARQLAF